MRRNEKLCYRRLQPLLFIGLAVFLGVAALQWSQRKNFLKEPPPSLQGQGVSSQTKDNLPPLGVSVAKIRVNNSFLYGFLGHDADSYQVKDEKIRALEPGLSALWVHKLTTCCEAGGMVIDIGSHFGYYALLGASLGCKFAAVEPVPLFRSVLEMNLVLNGFTSRGTVYPYALGKTEGHVHMRVPMQGVLGVARVDPNATEGILVEQKRFDKLFPVESLPQVCVLKADAEGSEPTVILSAAKLLNSGKVKHVMIEFSPGYGTAGLGEMLALLYKLKYAAIEVPWAIAKQGLAINDVDVHSYEENYLLFSSVISRQRFIQRIKKAFNTNLWFTKY